MAAALAITGCGDDDAADDTATAASAPAEIPDVIGDSVENATATLEDAGFKLRVVTIDGEELPVHRRFRGEPSKRGGRDARRRYRSDHRGCH